MYETFAMNILDKVVKFIQLLLDGLRIIFKARNGWLWQYVSTEGKTQLVEVSFTGVLIEHINHVSVKEVFSKFRYLIGKELILSGLASIFNIKLISHSKILEAFNIEVTYIS